MTLQHDAGRGATYSSKPSWLRQRAPQGERYEYLEQGLRKLKLATVCEEAKCPNMGECWNGKTGTATIMLLGTVLTSRHASTNFEMLGNCILMAQLLYAPCCMHMLHFGMAGMRCGVTVWQYINRMRAVRCHSAAVKHAMQHT